MAITPIEIRQHTFNKKFRGFDTEEVKAFLLTLSHEWERVQEEAKRIKGELEETRQQLAKLKEVESALHETLMQAKQSSQHTIESAEKTAALKIQEAQLESERTIDRAMNEKKRIESQLAEEAKTIRSELQDLLSRRNDILDQMHSFLENQLKRLQRFENKEAIKEATDKKEDSSSQSPSAENNPSDDEEKIKPESKEKKNSFFPARPSGGNQSVSNSSAEEIDEDILNQL